MDFTFQVEQSNNDEIEPSVRQSIHNEVESRLPVTQNMQDLIGRSLMHNRNKPTQARALGTSFQPGDWDVICGRGKTRFNHIGNRRLRVLVANNLKNYVNASTQLEKSMITHGIIEAVRNASPHGGFVEKDKQGRWFEIGTIKAREKVGHTIRDHMKGPLRRPRNGESVEATEKRIKESQDSIFRSCGLFQDLSPPRTLPSSATTQVSSSEM